MPEEIHGQQTASAAAQQGGEKQRSFRYAEAVFPRPAFVRKKADKAG